MPQRDEANMGAVVILAFSLQGHTVRTRAGVVAQAVPLLYEARPSFWGFRVEQKAKPCATKVPLCPLAMVGPILRTPFLGAPFPLPLPGPSWVSAKIRKLVQTRPALPQPPPGRPPRLPFLPRGGWLPGGITAADVICKWLQEAAALGLCVLQFAVSSEN